MVYITIGSKEGIKTKSASSAAAWAEVHNMEGLCERLVQPSPNRAQGTHDSQGVLVRAGPGTGKTVSLQQLTRMVRATDPPRTRHPRLMAVVRRRRSPAVVRRRRSPAVVRRRRSPAEESIAIGLQRPSRTRARGEWVHGGGGGMCMCMCTGNGCMEAAARACASRRLTPHAGAPRLRQVARRLQAGGEGAGISSGAKLVPMLLSVQRLASYMKKRMAELAGNADLLREYIELEYTGRTRDLLLQAYELRALVCCIDGVDEAAGLKSRVEDLVLLRLAPSGVRLVVSSRPEGVRAHPLLGRATIHLRPRILLRTSTSILQPPAT